MNVSEIRSEFSIYVVDADFATADALVSLLRGAGYDVRYYPTLDSASAGIIELPPHLVVFNLEAFPDVGESFLQSVREISPEILTLLLIASKQTIPALQIVEKGLAFDYQIRPYVSALEMIQKLDRGVQRLYYQFENEQLRETLTTDLNGMSSPGLSVAPSPAVPAAGPSTVAAAPTAPSVHSSALAFAPVSRIYGFDSAILEKFIAGMSSLKDLEQTIQGFLDAVSAQLHNAPVLYFKYIPHYLSLVLSQSSWLPIDKIRGIGVELKNLEISKLPDLFQEPAELEPLKILLRDAFKTERFSAFTHFNDADILGVFVIFDPLDDDAGSRMIQTFHQIFDLAYRRNLTLKEKHVLEILDPVTGVYGRKQFRVKLDEEISRSRRISMPLSMIVLDIDRFQDLNKIVGFAAADTILKMIGALLKKTARTNDVIGRLGADEMVVLLPHTDHMGAAVKAERIRRILESTRFPALEGRPIDHITVSIGVSEYPSLASDAESLIRTADEALSQVKEAGGNRVCLATPPPGFTPDFVPRPAQDAGKERR